MKRAKSHTWLFSMFREDNQLIWLCMKRLENTFCFGDSTDPYYAELTDFILDKDYIGKGYMRDIIHDFHSGNYENDNVITDIRVDTDIQILSNIWDEIFFSLNIYLN